ncbi:MAG: rod shape-determining protein [Ruminococcaceae bacterium]|nr:rod shape-determining protein [Oscillospiraceae bacterium]
MSIDIAIDLGTSKTVIYGNSRIILEEATMVTVDAETYEPVYFGEMAKESMGRTPETLLCVQPIERGAIADYDVAQAMMSKYMLDAFGNKIVRPRVMACLPTGLTELQHRFMGKVIEESGGRNVTVIASPLAIALGVGIDFTQAKGSMVVDIGAGVTDIATISMGGIVQCDSFKLASNDFDEAIIKFVRRKFNIEIGPLTAELIKKRVGTVVQRPVEITMIAKGKNLRTGLPETFEITSSQVYETVFDIAVTISNAVRKVLEKTDPDIVSDIMENGIYLTGGGSLIHGMAGFIEEFIGTKIIHSTDPCHSIIKGAALALKNPGLLKDIDYQVRSMKELIIE